MRFVNNLKLYLSEHEQSLTVHVHVYQHEHNHLYTLYTCITTRQYMHYNYYAEFSCALTNVRTYAQTAQDTQLYSPHIIFRVQSIHDYVYTCIHMYIYVGGGAH